jgi:stage II sporulation protein GA (sporulation sigma-E factor processing peptidase)
MGETVVYADLTWAVNFFTDFIILWVTLKLSGSRVNYYRLTAAAFLGSIYALLYLFFSTSIFYGLAGKLLFSFIMLYIALKPETQKDLKKNLFYFYLISFACAGASVALSFIFKENGKYSAYCLPLSGGIVFIIFLAVEGEKYLVNKVIPALLHYGVEIIFAQEKCVGQGFMDTGNGLKDPLTDKAVIVAEFDYMKSFLPEDLKQIIQDCDNEQELFNKLAETSWANRLRVIPFSSIGKKNGLLIGLRSDQVIIKSQKGEKLLKDQVIALYKDRLSKDSDYQFLLPASILF